MLQHVDPPAQPPVFVTGRTGAPSANAEGAMALFEGWAAAGLFKTGKRRKLSGDTVNHYRTFWKKWVEWMTKEGLVWNTATSAAVTRYLDEVPARAHANHGEASGVTRRRYWRLLRDVYRHALPLDWIDQNPCDEALEVPRSEVVDRLLLPPGALKYIHDGIVSRHARRETATWRDIRNDALQLVLIHTALKTSELRQLHSDQLWTGSSTTHGTHYRLIVEGQRLVQKRQLPLLDPDVARIFAKWMQERSTVPGCPQWVFFGQKTEIVDGVVVRKQLRAKSVFLLVSEAIRDFVPANSGEYGLQHVGSETLRNSVIADWIGMGVSMEEIMERAGVAELRAISRLDRRPAMSSSHVANKAE